MNSQNKIIICSNVPLMLLNKTDAKRYFEKFGKIVKLVVKPKSKKCTVEYATADAAEQAVILGGDYMGCEFRIEYQMKTSSKRKANKDPDPDWDLDPDVQAELEAMSNYSTSKKVYNTRPEKMSVEADMAALSKKPERKSSSKRSDRNVETKKPSAKSSSKTLAAENELLHVLRQRAATTEEKYRALEARDKLIRLRRNKTIDMHNIKTTVGTCPDMCSEKERLMREVQHQVSLYEQEIGDRTMNHSIAVKQYSRSSADQEMPLPHELRNVDVLQMTMGYLMHRIMHLCDTDVNLADWYHFLWDRTRGIRKDITQQELCCQGSVALVEQCARFHIHCSARLVAEDPSVFDQKINTENLTKCLQTLKYMYHDLAVKGERCPHEAEFRAYVILLNLNDGNFMWEVQQLQSEIQRSHEIKFALDVYSSLDKNNYMRFFKLVNATTYLNACILLRYFIQVRTKALRTIVQCYTPRLPHANFPIEQLTNMLAFEGRAATIDFAEYYGLSLSDDGNYVVLNKRDFSLPDLPYALDRAVNVIESKRTQSVGEVVCGASLPPPFFASHRPQNSFDADGYLLNLTEFEVDNTNRDEIDKAFSIKDRSNSPFSFDTNSRESWPKSMFQSKTQPKGETKLGGFSFPLQSMQQQHHEQEQEQMKMQQLKEQRLREERARHEQEAYEQGLQKDREMERERLREEQQQHEQEQMRIIEEAKCKAEERRREAERMHHEEMERMRHYEEQKKIQRQQEEQERKRQVQVERVAAQKRIEEKERQIQLVAEEKHKLQMHEIQATVRQVVADLVKQTEVNYRRDRLNELKTKSLSRCVVQKWKKRVASNKRKRKAIDQGPLWLNRLTTSEMAQELYTPNQNMTLYMMKRYKRGVATTCHSHPKSVVREVDLAKLSANELIKNALRSKRLQNEIYWKVGLYFDESFAIVNNTVNAFIGWDASRIVIKQVKENQNTLTYCCHKTDLQTTDSDINGLIVVVDNLTEDFLDTLLEFLNNLGDLVCLPIVFILQEHNPTLESEIDTLCANKLISERDIIVCQFNQENLVEGLEHGIQFLSKYYRPAPAVFLNTLKSFLIENLGGELWQRIRSFAKWNLAYKRCVAKPKVAIGLVNQALDKLISIAFNEQRLEHATFPKTFKDFLPNQIPDYLPCDFKYFPSFWKLPRYNTILRNVLEGLKLPEYNGKWPLVGHELELNLRSYVTNIFRAPDKVFYKIMGKVLKSPSINWLDIVEVIIEELLVTVNMSLPTEYKTQTVFNQLFVVYQHDDLRTYLTDTWFYLKNHLVQEEIDTNLDSVQLLPDRDPFIVYEEEDEDIDIDIAMKELIDDDVEKSNNRKCKAALDDFRMLLNDLEMSMSIQKQVSETFQHNLKSVLEDSHV